MAGLARRALAVLAAIAPLSCGLAISFDGYETGRSGRTLALKGTVDGLEGARVTLTVSRAFTLPPTDNGDFAFPDAVASDSDYVVEASAPAHTCKVEHGSGHAESADVVGVLVHCLSSDPTLASLALSSGVLEPAFDPPVHAYRARVPWYVDPTVTAATRSPRGSIRIGDDPPIVTGLASGPRAFASVLSVPVVGVAADGTLGAPPYTLALRRQDYLKASNTRAIAGPVGQQQAAFGAALAISADGSTIAVGAPNEDTLSSGVGAAETSSSRSSSGAVYVFVRSGSTWTQQAFVKAQNSALQTQSDTGSPLRFGAAVALSASGDTLVVGAPLERGNATGVNGDMTDISASFARGAAYVYRRQGGTWSFEAYFKPHAATTLLGFGTAVASSASGDRVAVGAPSRAPGPDDASVYLFARTGSTTWVEEQQLTAASNWGFGSALALDAEGSTLAVGAPRESRTIVDGSNSLSIAGCGGTYVFGRVGSTWAQQKHVQPRFPVASTVNTAFAVAFGTSVALSASGDALAVGAPDDSGNAIGVDGAPTAYDRSQSGAVYTYTRAGAEWSDGAFLKPSVILDSGHFGTSVALSGDGSTMLVGEIGESSGSAGFARIAGPGGDIVETGAAFLFGRASSTWSQEAVFKGPAPQQRAHVGQVVGLANGGTTIVLGAPGEGSNARGVNGESANQFVPGAGAVYVY